MTSDPEDEAAAAALKDQELRRAMVMDCIEKLAAIACSPEISMTHGDMHTWTVEGAHPLGVSTSITMRVRVRIAVEVTHEFTAANNNAGIPTDG